MLWDASRVLIIDTKFYGRILQENRENRSVRNGHLYQVHAYVMNHAAPQDLPRREVSGLLLYAETGEQDAVPSRWTVGGMTSASGNWTCRSRSSGSPHPCSGSPRTIPRTRSGVPEPPRGDAVRPEARPCRLRAVGADHSVTPVSPQVCYTAHMRMTDLHPGDVR